MSLQTQLLRGLLVLPMLLLLAMAGITAPAGGGPSHARQTAKAAAAADGKAIAAERELAVR